MGIHIGWKSVGQLTLGILNAVIPAVGHIETAARAIPTLKGEAKTDAVVELVRGAFDATNQLSGHAVLDSQDGEAAVRAIIKSVVALQNLTAKDGQ